MRRNANMMMNTIILLSSNLECWQRTRKSNHTVEIVLKKCWTCRSWSCRWNEQFATCFTVTCRKVHQHERGKDQTVALGDGHLRTWQWRDLKSKAGKGRIKTATHKTLDESWDKSRDKKRFSREIWREELVW